MQAQCYYLVSSSIILLYNSRQKEIYVLCLKKK